MSFLIYIPTIIFLIILIIHMIKGLLNGFRKSVILFVNMIIAFMISIIIFFIIFRNNFNENLVTYLDFIFTKINNQQLYQVLGTNTKRELFSDYILDYIILNYSSLISNINISITNLMILLFSLVEVILRIVMLVVISIIYIILKFLLYIIYLIFFKEGRFKKKIQKQFLEGIRTKDYKKRRLLGLLIGTIRGLIVGVIVLSFVGYNFYSFTNGEYSNEELNLVDEELFGIDINPYVEIINQYGKTGVGHILESIGGENGPWYLLIADSFLTSKYEVEIDGSIVEGSLNYREELGPIIGFIKDSYLLLRDYGYSINDFSSMNISTLNELFNKKKDDISFKEALDCLIEDLNLGLYTIYLGQTLLSSAIDSIYNSKRLSSPFVSELFNVLFYGDNSIKSSQLVTNDSLKTTLIYLVDLIDNLPGITELFLSTSSNQSLVFGLTPLTEQTKSKYKALENILLSTSQLIDDLEFLNDGLLTDVLICLTDYIISLQGTFDVEEDIYNEYKLSCTHFETKKDLTNILIDIKDMIEYLTKFNIKDTNSLLNEVIENIDNEDSELRNLLDIILNSSISGILFNNPYVISYLSKKLYNSSNCIISLSLDIHLGSYYENGIIKKGDLYLIINNYLNELKEIYSIIKDNSSTQMLIKSLFANEDISNTLISMVDTSSTKYVKTMHSIISSVLINIDNVMSDSTLRIIIEEQYIYRDIISSKELVEALNVIDDYIPIFFEENFNYKDDLSIDLVTDIANVKLLRGTMAELVYSMLSAEQSYSNYIPSSYVLGRGNEANLINWTKEDGEIDCLISIINSGNEENNLLNLIFNLDTTSDNIMNDFLDLDYEILEKFENALLKSNVINCVLCGNLESISLASELTITIPRMCLEQVDDQYKVVRDINIFTILKETQIFEHLNSETYKNDIINYFLNDDFHIEKIFENAILNSIMIQVFRKQNSNTISIIIPTSAYTDEAILYNDTVVKTEEIITTIDYLKHLLDNSSGKYNLNSFNYNEIFKIDLSKCDIIGATFANILIKDISKKNSTIIIPSNLNLSNDELQEGYLTSGWKNEIINIIDGLNTMNVSFINNSSNVSVDVNEIILELNNTKQDSDKTNLERIYSSDILKLTIKSEYDKITSTSTKILLPKDALEILNSNEEEAYISYNEISILSNIINEFNITNLSTFKVNEIFNDSTKFEFLDNTIKESYILRYNITYYIENDSSLNSKVSIPQIAYDMTTESEMITKTEASSLISIIEICGNFNSFDYNKIIGNDNINELLDISSILRYTITSNLKDDTLTIPNEVYEAYSLNLNDEKIIQSFELKALFNVIDIFGLSNTSEFNFDNFLNISSVKYINSSLIMRATVTTTILKTECLVVSKRAIDCSCSTNILKEQELEYFINAINSMGGISQLEDTNVSLNVVIDKIDIILQSEILLDTISFKLYEKEALLEKEYNYVSNFASDNKLMYIIKEEEIKTYMNAISNILKDDAEYGAVIDLNNLANPYSAIEDICSSKLMLTTYSDVVEDWLKVKFGSLIDTSSLTSLTDNVCMYDNKFNTCSLDIINKEYILNFINTI